MICWTVDLEAVDSMEEADSMVEEETLEVEVSEAPMD